MKSEVLFALFRGLLCLIFSIFIGHSYAQKVGGTGPGQQMPGEVKPSELSGGAYGGSVNLFTGSYQSSYPLGTVSTVGGLSFSLSLNYSSNTVGGTEVPLASGIPYGEGWSPSLPSISVTTEDWMTYTSAYMNCTYSSFNNNNDSLFELIEGDLFWFAPTISIPGVGSGRLVYKYSDKNQDHFVLNTFESGSYLEVIKTGSSWQATTVDGTVYEFGLAHTAYRSASNKRNFGYNSNGTIAANPTNFTEMRNPEADTLKGQIVPRGEYLQWYCTKIWNKNLPFRQSILFEYEKFGKFNFYKEYSYNHQQRLVGSMTNEFDLNTPYPDFDTYSDVILQKVQAIDYMGPTEILELEHRTFAYPGYDMLKVGDPGVFRFDSLYNYEVVYEQGTGTGNNFSSWNRYCHIKHPDIHSAGYEPTFASNNPYHGLNSTSDNNYYVKYIAGASLDFDHGYLESPRLGDNSFSGDFKLIPGDIYEIQTEISATGLSNVDNFCNFDINLATGENQSISFNPLNNGFATQDFALKNETTRETVFTTFNKGLKWNARGHKSNAIVTSNFFSMPNLPEDYEGFHIQVGPANSDNDFRMGAINNVDPFIESPTKPNVWLSYSNVLSTSLNNYSSNPGLYKAIQSPGNNFGVGLPWFQMNYIYDYLADLNPTSSSQLLDKWWNKKVPSSFANWTNVPTLAGSEKALKSVKLIRYSKNPWLLRNVKKYVLNGEYNGITDPGKVLVSQLELDYGRQDDTLIDNRYYTTGATAVLNYDRQHYIFTLNKIKTVPVDPSNNGWATVAYDPNKIPTTHLKYVKIPTWSILATDTIVHHNAGGILLDTIVNHLGGITAIEYYPKSDARTLTTSRANSASLSGCIGGLPTMGNGGAIEINYAVKSMATVDTSGIQKRIYDYSQPVFRIDLAVMDPQHFKVNRTNFSYGFKNTTVYEPEIASGVIPYTKYVHHTADNPLFGKMVSSKKYDHNNNLNQSQDFTYEFSQAYKNGNDRASAWHNWDYDYDDYQGVVSPWDTIAPTITEFTFGMLKAPKFYEIGPSSNQDADYRHSWFVKLTKESVVEYDQSGCVKDNSPPIQGNTGFFNPISTNDLLGIPWDENYPGFLDTLLARSPLSDSLMSLVVNPNQPLSNNLIQAVFNAQPDVSDAVLVQLMDRSPVVAESTIENIFLNLPNDHTDPVLLHLIGRSSTNNFLIVRNVLLVQNYLSDAVMTAAINRSPVLPEPILETVLMNRVNLSESVLLDLINRPLAVSNQTLQNVLTAASPYPTDAVLLSMLYRTAPSPVDSVTIKAVLIQSPYTISDTLDASLDLRAPFLLSGTKTGIRDAQAGKVDYATYLSGVLSNPALQQSFSNAATNSNAAYLIGLLGGSQQTIYTQYMAHSPLEDAVLANLLNFSPQVNNSMVGTILRNQPDVSDAILTLLIQRGFSGSTVYEVLKEIPHDFTDALLFTILNREPKLTSAKVQALLMKQPTLSQAVLLSLANGTYDGYGQPMLEAVLLKQPSLPETVLTAVANRPRPFSNTSVAAMFIKQPIYPSNATITTLIENSPPISESAVINVLLSSPVKLPPSVMDGIDQFSTFYLTAGNHGNENKPNGTDTSLTEFCVNPATSELLYIEKITDYEYYEASFDGSTTSEGYRRMMGVSDLTIDLKYEPSWQVWRTTTYSPQVPGAFSQNENFLYYDLKNRYYRHDDLPPNWSLNGDDLTFFDPTGNIALAEDLSDFHQLQLPYDYGLRTMPFQQRHSSKNAVDMDALVRNDYFVYDNKWYNSESPYDFEEIDISGQNPCPPQDTSISTEFFGTGCVGYKYISSTYWPGVPFGWAVYEVTVPVNQLSFMLCPYGALDVSQDSIYLAYAYPAAGSGNDPSVLDSTVLGDVVQPNPLSKFMLHRSTFTQVDTIPTDRPDYYNIFNDHQVKLMAFKREQDASTSSYWYEPSFPFDTLRTHHVLKRNLAGFVELEADEKGLQTRYYFNRGKSIWYKDTNCHANSYSASIIENAGLPYRIVQGYGLNDSLQTLINYNKNFSIDSIIDANGMVLQNRYSDFGKLQAKYRNGIRVDSTHYHTWENDESLSYKEKTEQNFVETFTFNNDNSLEAERSRAWLDPLGRAFHGASQVTPNAELATLGTSIAHTGITLYDAWNRPIRTFKPFLHQDGGNLVDFDLRLSSTNTSIYPNAYSDSQYENDHFARPLKKAKPGEDISTGHTVDFDYRLVNYLCMLCELDLSDYEISLLMPTDPEDYVFRRVQTTDEDNKIVVDFANALGQKVATKQVISSGDNAVTLFVYDSYGNLTKVINPEDQQSDNLFNIMGWMYQQETVDGGKAKFMYNKSGQVVLELDANGDVGFTFPGYIGNQNVYRAFDYDDFGRLTEQSRFAHSFAVFDPLSFQTAKDTTYDGPLVYYHNYKNSNAASLSFLSDYSIAPNSSGVNNSAFNGTFQFSDFGFKAFEKKLYYHTDFDTSDFDMQPNALPWLVNDRTNMKGLLSHSVVYDHDSLHINPTIYQNPIEYGFYSYNNDGELKWQIKQFNPYGIRAGAKGLLNRIDYSNYDTRGNLKIQSIDIHSDMELDIQYSYQYDGRGRIQKVFANLDNSGANGEKIASYSYNEAYGLITQTKYHKSCNGGGSYMVDSIQHTYDVRDRLTYINSTLFGYQLFYDGNLPQFGGNNLIGHQNYNGNINGLKAEYKFQSNGISVPGFDDPTYYAYQYDGLNRLTNADAVAGDLADPQTDPNSLLIGDAAYQYDKIGNISWLQRRLAPGQGGGSYQNESWNYAYQTGSNRLNSVNGIGATTTRNYTYDPAGNVLTDDHRQMIRTQYGRGNLPYSIDIGTKTADYLSDGSDSRIYKDLTETVTTSVGAASVDNMEYYLTNAAGQTIGILDMIQGSWTWYAFGRDRFAKIIPDTNQQPNYYPGDIGNPNSDSTTTSLLGPIGNQLNGFDLGGGEISYPTNVVLGTINSQEAKLYLATDWQSQIAGLSQGSYSVLDGFEVESSHQPIVFTRGGIKINGIPFEMLGRLNVDDTTTLQGDLPNWVYSSGSNPNNPPGTWTYHSSTQLDSMAFYIHDHLGNTRIVYSPYVTCGIFEGEPDTLAAYNIQSVLDYYPFGKKLRSYFSANGEEKYLTTHHERDEETGLDHRGARYYDADVARFLNLDAATNLFPSKSGYGYVSNNPITRIDPDGNIDFDYTVSYKLNEDGTYTKIVKASAVYYVVNVSEANKYLSAANADFSLAKKAFSKGKFSANAPGAAGGNPLHDDGREISKVQFSLSIEVRTKSAKHYSLIPDGANILFIVDEVSGSDAVGKGDLDGQVIVSQRSEIGKPGHVAHEVGHNLNLHFDDNSGDTEHSKDKSSFMYSSGGGNSGIPKNEIQNALRGLTGGGYQAPGSYHAGNNNAKEAGRKLLDKSKVAGKYDQNAHFEITRR